MHFESLLGGSILAMLVAAAGASSHQLGRTVPGKACGSKGRTAKLRDSMATLKAREDSFADVNISNNTQTNITVPVHIHASLPSNSSDKLVSEAQLQEQLEVMRERYAPYGINLVPEGVTRELNDSLSTFVADQDDDGAIIGSTDAMEDYWKRHRTGSYETLHVFIYYSMPDFEGICSFPLKEISPSEYFLDSCHVAGATLPGANNKYLNEGLTAVHEAGHWLGLLHTFGDGDGACPSEDPDLVDDTPIQGEATQGEYCPDDKDTCPDLPGFDNVHNYMDYSRDSCLKLFTPGQQRRMHNSFNSLRAGR